ncbi:MAG: hypothetical protein N2654_07170 [Deltaproteobacteria bacterium]|nr:hypothetical protein [Deltaproteobacteria bacterium]
MTRSIARGVMPREELTSILVHNARLNPRYSWRRVFYQDAPILVVQIGDFSVYIPCLLTSEWDSVTVPDKYFMVKKRTEHNQGKPVSEFYLSEYQLDLILAVEDIKFVISRTINEFINQKGIRFTLNPEQVIENIKRAHSTINQRFFFNGRSSD